MMKVLLINPPWRIKPKSLWSEISGVFPPLGLGYIASLLRANRISVEILDLNALQKPPETLWDFLKDRSYQWIGITATTNLIPSAKKLAQIAKASIPTAKIIMGGIHPSTLPEEILSWQEVDFVVRGEGELTALELIQGKAEETIKGLSYKKDGNIIHNPDREFIPNLDTLAFPAWDLLPIKNYMPTLGGYKKLPAVSLITSRGCSGACSYCNNFFGRKVRKRSPENVVQELEMLVKDYGIKEIYFYDDSFTEQPSKVIELCKQMVKANLNLSWSCFAQINIINQDLLRAMKQAGCHHIAYGIESGNQEILARINKKVQKEKIQEIIALTKKEKIDLLLGFMLGLPGETKETLQETLNFALELDPDLAIFNITTPFPGTELFRWAEKNGYLKIKTWEDYDLYTVVMNLPSITEQEILNFYAKAHRNFYLRPKYLLRRFFKVRSWLDFKQNLQAFLIIVRM